MDIMHVALGGCLKAPPVNYGLTEDTGGHIAYVLGAAMAQAERPRTRVRIVTRAFDDPDLGPDYALRREPIGQNAEILRLRTADSRYLDKGALWAALPQLEAAFLKMLAGMDRKPDVIHAHFADAARLAMAASKAFGIPWIYTPHSLAQDKAACGYGPEGRRIEAERRAIGGADAVIASSRDEADRQIPAYDGSAGAWTHRVPPGIALPDTHGTAGAEALLAPFLRRQAKPFLLAIARPVRKKNLLGLLEAYSASPALRSKANLVIVAGLRTSPESGGDEQRAVIDGLLKGMDRHDLWGRVALPQRHDPSHIPQLYRLAAERGGVFVNPALHEPFGLTLIEAASFGLPVVATREGGPSDILDTLGHGRLVDPRDGAQIASTCLSLLNPAARAEASAAAASARASYSWQRWAERVDVIIRGLARPSTAARPAMAAE